MCSSTCILCTAFCMPTRITGAVHTCPCWYLVLVPLLYSASLGQPNAGKCALFALPLAQFAWVSRALNILARVGTCAGTSFVQCFAWSAQAMYLLARVHVCVVCESLHSVYCACISCTVLRLVRTSHIPTCPCSHLYRYLLCSWTARALYLLARVRNVPTCPCLYPCTVFCYG